ncbi:MAG: peroxidase family protein [Candidatus Acidiferrales bacterium]
MSGKHGVPLRGLTTASGSELFQGRFGRMFRSLPAAEYGHGDEANMRNLGKLGAKMSNTFDAPKDGQDDEESGIPALYTYFGQFIDHDITFDPSSSLQKQDDPDALTDFRSPALDLDNVYGRGPNDQPYMYDGDKLFLLGDQLKNGMTDLPRNVVQPHGAPPQDPKHSKPRRALIGDSRNDENAIVSQLQGLFHRFHNRVVLENPDWDFSEVQQFVRFHYEYVVLNDFLPRIVHSSVINDLKTGNQYDPGKLKYFHWRNDIFMPVEFSVAAYRLGHSMIRPGYRLNDDTLLPIFPVPKEKLFEGLTGFREMNRNWGIDWGRFIDIDVRAYDGSESIKKKRLQFAYRIDTSIVNPLAGLPASVVDPNDPPDSLAQRNLIRAYRLGLPSGQVIARSMGLRPLDDKEILIGQGIDKPGKQKTAVDVDEIFADNCPLWTYILAEAMHYKESVRIPVKENLPITTPRLGPVGGRIVAEVFLGLLWGDNNSFMNLDPNWQPKIGACYALKDFVNYALGK